jgi:hypothetical protein
MVQDYSFYIQDFLDSRPDFFYVHDCSQLGKGSSFQFIISKKSPSLKVIGHQKENFRPTKSHK